MGRLVRATATPFTGVGIALGVVARARAAGFDDEDIVRRYPVVLALTPPRIGGVALPAGVQPSDAPAPSAAGDRDRNAVLREALRIRARWLQELCARAVQELARRLVERQVLRPGDDVRLLRLEELRVAVIEGRRPADLRGRGPVCHDPARVVDGDVLVVRTLDPSLAPSLRRLGGLVAETGNVLAHLAILAREAGVPTVVGASGAVERYPEGTVVEVDGMSGSVREVDGR
jgi:pyruvate,water dikinase